MSLVSACLWTLARTLVICLVAWPVCVAVERWLRGLSDPWRGRAIGVLFAPFCFPELLVGYALRDIALAHPRWAEALCSGWLFVRVVPVGAVALLMAPTGAPDAAAALHCRRLLVRARKASSREWLELVRCYWHGPVARALPALGLMAVVSFQEFELAALLMTTSWTDWFIAADNFGLKRGEMLRQASWPLLMQLPVLLGLSVWWRRDAACRRDGSSDDVAANPAGRAQRMVCSLAAVYTSLAFVAGCIVPLSLIGWKTFDALKLLLRQRTQQVGLAREMMISMAVAVCAGLTAWTICRCVSRSFVRRPPAELAPGQARWRSAVPRWGVTFGLLLPGLLGSLLLSLGTVSLFQFSWLRLLYDTPLPWVLALTLWLLPRAAVLQLWLEATRPSEAVHLAEMLGGQRAKEQGARDEGQGTRDRELKRGLSVCPSSLSPCPSALLWRLRDQPQFLAISLLCYWAYCDLPTAHLLAPTGMASGLVRLYNFMHFGRSAALSVEAGLFFAAPLVGVGFVLLVVRWWRG